MDIVLGASVSPATVRMLLIEGENADGLTVDEDNFDVAADDESVMSAAADQLIAAIQGTRESAIQAGHALMSIGVTWTEPAGAAALRDALASREVGQVMLVSPLLAAAVLAQTVGGAMGYAHTALLFIEPQSATVAVVDTSDGAIVDLHRHLMHSAEASAELAEMVAGLGALESRPDGVFVVGCGVDIVPIKPRLDGATTLAVNAPEEPDMALARGAALASANAPLFASSTAALAYAQDPGTGEVDPYAVAPAYLDVSGNANQGSGALAYSALPHDDDRRLRVPEPFLLAGSALVSVFLIGVVALVISLVAGDRPIIGQRPRPGGNVVPTKQLPAPSAQPAQAAPPVPSAPPTAPAPPPETITDPAPVAAPRVAAVPVRQAPRRPPAYVPSPVQAPAPEPPAAPPPAALPPAREPPPPAAPPPAPSMPPMTVYLHLPFVTVPIPINPPPPPPGP
ncbi:MAG TPA: hypothetical protein VE400_05560 [Mycobacterium sp.]|nr:hypothetical protein [Mycobacterium sp.]